MLAKHLLQEARRLFPAIEFVFDADIEVRIRNICSNWSWVPVDWAAARWHHLRYMLSGSYCALHANMCFDIDFAGL